MINVLIVTYLLITETVQLAIVAAIGGFTMGLIPSVFIVISAWANKRAAAEAAIVMEKKAMEDRAAVAAAAAAAAAASQARLTEIAAEQKLIATKADTIIEQGVRVHELANSNLSQQTALLGVANEKILGMETLIKLMVSNKAVADNLDIRKEINGARPLGAAATGTEPVPVVDDQVADLLKGEVTDKLDTIQGAVDHPPADDKDSKKH